MKKLLILLCVLVIGSPAMAYFEDFESYTPAIIAGDGYTITNPTTYDDVVDAGFENTGNDAYIAVGLGTNTGNVVEAWGNAFATLLLPEAEQYNAGTLELDFTMESTYANPGPNGYTALHLYMADVDYTGGLIANLQIVQWAGAGTAAGYDVVDKSGTGPFTVLATDIATRTDGWHSLKIDFTTGVGGAYDVKIDNTSIASGVSNFGFQNELSRVTIVNDASYVMQWDNLSITPEPATMALLALGGLMIRRKK